MTATLDTTTDIVEETAAFLADTVRPQVDRYTRNEQMPDDVLSGVTKLGLWAPFLPPSVGGLGASWVTFGQLHMAIGRIDSSLRSILTAHSLVAESVRRWGSAAQKERWLPGLASGEQIASFCLTGNESGSASSVSDTYATSDGNGWVLSGTKKWTTSAQRSRLILVFADTPAGMTAFLVPRDTPGVSATPTFGMCGARANLLGEMHFDQVHLGPEAVLGPVGRAKAYVMTSALGVGRLSVAAGCVGIIEACLDLVVSYTKSRLVGNDRLLDKQLVRRKVSDMYCARRTGALLVEHAAHLRDTRASRAIEESWIAKYPISEAAYTAASHAVELLGANGCSSDYPAFRYLGDAAVMRIIEGTSHIQQDIIADFAEHEFGTSHIGTDARVVERGGR
jgi:alkylation response protein AidB-like acyl-CoA dehydrogenase